MIDIERLATWMDGQGPRGGAPIEQPSSRAEPRTRSTRSGGATCTAPCGSRRRRPRRAATTGILREWRIIEALDGTDVPHTAAIAACDDRSVLGRTFYLMGYVDGWSPMNTDGWPAPFDTDLEAREGLAFELVDGIALLSRSTGRPRASTTSAAPTASTTARSTGGRRSSSGSRGGSCPGSTRRRPGCGRTGRSTSSPGSCTVTTSSPTSCSATGHRPGWQPSWTGRWARSVIPSSTWPGSSDGWPEDTSERDAASRLRRHDRHAVARPC